MFFEQLANEIAKSSLTENRSLEQELIFKERLEITRKMQVRGLANNHLSFALQAIRLSSGPRLLKEMQ